MQSISKSSNLRAEWLPEDVEKLIRVRAAHKGATWDRIKELTGSGRSGKALQLKHAREEKARSQAAKEVESEGAGTITRHLDLPPLTTKPEGTLAQDTTNARGWCAPDVYHDNADTLLDPVQACPENASVVEADVDPDSLAVDYLLAMEDTRFEAAKEMLQSLNNISPNSALTATSNIACEQIQKVVDVADDLTTITLQQQEEMHSRYYVANAATQHLGGVLGLDHISTPSRQERTFLVTQRPHGANFKFLCDVTDCNSKTAQKYSFTDHMRKKHSAPDATTGVGRTGFEITDCEGPMKTWDAKLKTDPEGKVRWTGHFWDVALGKVATADSSENDDSEDITVERKWSVESGQDSVRSGVH